MRLLVDGSAGEITMDWSYLDCDHVWVERDWLTDGEKNCERCGYRLSRWRADEEMRRCDTSSQP